MKKLFIRITGWSKFLPGKRTRYAKVQMGPLIAQRYIPNHISFAWGKPDRIYVDDAHPQAQEARRWLATNYGTRPCWRAVARGISISW